MVTKNLVQDQERDVAGSIFPYKFQDWGQNRGKTVSFLKVLVAAVLQAALNMEQ